MHCKSDLHEEFKVVSDKISKIVEKNTGEVISNGDHMLTALMKILDALETMDLIIKGNKDVNS